MLRLIPLIKKGLFVIHPQTHINKKELFLKYWVPVLLYGLLIFYLSSQSYPDQQLPSFLFSISDKILHAFEYGILGILLFRAFKQTTQITQSISLAIFCVLAYGISDEMHQWFVPQRQADVWDLVADTVGAAILILVWVTITEEKWRRGLTTRN